MKEKGIGTSDNEKESVKEEKTNIRYKRIVQIILIGGVLSVLFMVLCGYEDGRVKTVSLPVTESTEEFEFSVGEVTVGDVVVIRDAYIFIPGEKIGNFDVRVILRSVSTGECLEIPTISNPDTIICDMYNDYQNNLERAVFSANVKSDKLDLNNTDYDIIIYYNNDGLNDYYFTGYKLTAGGITD